MEGDRRDDGVTSVPLLLAGGNPLVFELLIIIYIGVTAAKAKRSVTATTITVRSQILAWVGGSINTAMANRSTDNEPRALMERNNIQGNNYDQVSAQPLLRRPSERWKTFPLVVLLYLLSIVNSKKKCRKKSETSTVNDKG